LRRGDYDRIFGTPVAPQQQTQVYTPSDSESNRLYGTLAKFKLVNPRAA
jgi:hypothetical protein